MSAGMTNDVITRLHRAFNERDAETVRALIADDVLWHIPGNHPLAGTFTGRERVWEDFLAPLWPTPARIEDHAALAHPDHDHAAALVDVINDFGEGEVRFRGMEVARVVDGRIVERWGFDEDQDLVDRTITKAMQADAEAK